MKINRQVLEHLIETNSEGYALLHYQYTALETEYNQLKHTYNKLRSEFEESVSGSSYRELKEEAALMREETNRLTQALIEAEEEKARLHKMLKEAQEKQQTAEYEARMYRVRFEEINHA